MRKKLMRVWVVAMLTALLVSMAPSALAAGSFKAVVAGKSMKVYAHSSPHKLIGTLPKGETVTVKAYSGKAALISYKGNTGIARVSDLMAVAGGTDAGESAKSNSGSVDAVQSGSSKAVVTTKDARVYRKASAKSGYVTVKAGTTLTLLATSGNVAKVKRGDTVGYIDARSLGDPSENNSSTTTEITEKTASGDVQKYDRKAVVTAEACRVYARPSASSAYVSVEKGTKLVLLATKGSCAMVERDGAVGYMNKGSLTADTSSAASTSSPVQTADNSVDLAGNNEQIVFKFLTKIMGYNTAAACGVMANIKYESGYKPTSGGDSGTSYGIVQWHLGRKTRLIEWCGSNGYDHTTLEGQLYYLQYELKNRYPAVHKRMLAVENSEQGAYDAGYDFCYNFEAPSNRASRSVTRGNYARDTLWNRYKA